MVQFPYASSLIINVFGVFCQNCNKKNPCQNTIFIVHNIVLCCVEIVASFVMQLYFQLKDISRSYLRDLHSELSDKNRVINALQKSRHTLPLGHWSQRAITPSVRHIQNDVSYSAHTFIPYVQYEIKKQWNTRQNTH